MLGLLCIQNKMAARSTFRANLFQRVLVDRRSINHGRNVRITPSKKARKATGVISSSFHWNKLCCVFLSAEATANMSTDTNIPQINIAVCVERVPQVTASKSDLENQYEELQERLELEHSSLCDYELNKTKIMMKREQLKNDEDNEELKKEVAQLDSEYQELIDIEQQQIKDVSVGSRITEEDLSNDCRTPNRKLDLPLFLLTQSQETPKKWLMPQGHLSSDETLRQAAERIIKEYVHIDVHFMSNAPSGVFRRPEKDGAKVDAPKVFFYRAQLSRSVQKYGKETWSNCMWASKNELAEHLPSNYYQSIARFLF